MMTDHRATPRPASFVWADNPDELQAEPSAFGTYPAPERRTTVGHKLANLLRRMADYVEYRLT